MSYGAMDGQMDRQISGGENRLKHNAVSVEVNVMVPCCLFKKANLFCNIRL